MELRMVSWVKTLLDDLREVSPQLALSIYRNRHLTHLHLSAKDVEPVTTKYRGRERAQ